MRKAEKIRRAVILHRAFWSIYAASSILLGFSSWYLSSRTLLGANAFGFLAAVLFMLFQEALFLYFIRLERLYLGYLRSGYFHGALVVSNILVIGAMGVAGLGNWTPAPVPDCLFAGWGLVGGNLGCAMALGLGFGIARHRIVPVRRR